MSTRSRGFIPIIVLLTLCAARVWAQENHPAGGNLLGQNGILRLAAATPHPAGWISVGTDFQYYQSGDLLTTNQDHSRLVNSYMINWAPFRFLEGAFALHVITDNSSGGGRSDELQVAVGDPEISLKGGAQLGYGFALGALFDLRFPSGAGYFEAVGSAANVTVAALASWSSSTSIPILVHLNLGYFHDGSENLIENPQTLSEAQRFSAQISSFDRFITRLGFEVLTPYVSPFLELSLEPYLGGDAPEFSKSPGLFSLGVRVWPTRQKGLQLLAAADIGITGVGDGSPILPGVTDQYAVAIPRWNLLFQMSYRFDPFAKPTGSSAREGEVGETGDERSSAEAAMGVVQGSVLDSNTDKPIWNARISIEGEDVSSLSVNPNDGTYRTFKLRPGSISLVASADGYNPTKTVAEVLPNQTVDANFKLSPRTTILPGTLRGTIKSVAGKAVRDANVLIPEIDRTIEVGDDGSFTVSLKPGEYKIVVSAKGYRSQTKTINILEGSTVILNVDLYK